MKFSVGVHVVVGMRVGFCPLLGLGCSLGIGLRGHGGQCLGQVTGRRGTLCFGLLGMREVRYASGLQEAL